jgi:hypothetical protein
MKFLTSCWHQLLLAFALCVSSGAQAATIVLDATNSSNGVVLDLAPGMYNIAYVSGAWTPWSDVIGCDANGEYCSNGWVNSFFIELPHGSGWISDGMRYATPSQAEAAGIAILSFKIFYATAGTLGLSLPDSYYGDNAGSIALSITPVPEPESYAMLLLGLAFVGAIACRSKRV